MKKLFVLIIVLSTSYLYSQIIKDYGLKIGGTISHEEWNFSSFGFDSKFNPDNKLGFNLGVFVETSDISFIKLVGELNFVQKGIEEKGIIRMFEYPEGIGESDDWQLGLNYLNISILLKPNLNFGLLRPYLLIGPKVDLELSKSIKSSSSFYDQFEEHRMGIKLGIGSEIDIINFRLLAEFIYDTDLSNLYKNKNLEITSYSYDFRVGIYF